MTLATLVLESDIDFNLELQKMYFKGQVLVFTGIIVTLETGDGFIFEFKLSLGSFFGEKRKLKSF